MTQDSADTDLIKQAINHYREGLRNSSGESLRQAFHPQAAVIGIQEGKFFYNTTDQFVDHVGSSPSPASTGEDFSVDILSIDQTGEAATVKVACNIYGYKYTDYLSLLKVEGSWIIMNKVFRHEPKN